MVMATINLMNKDGETAMMIASKHGHTDVVMVLCDAGADIDLKNKDGETAMMTALNHGRMDVVKILTDFGADFDAFNAASKKKLLFKSAQCGLTKMW